MVINRLTMLKPMTLRIVSKNVFQRLVASNSTEKMCTGNRSFHTKKSEVNTDQQNEQLKKEEEEEEEQPVKYSTSPAAVWYARHSQAGEDADDTPWYQPPAILASVAIFLTYFAFIREPSDIDDIFEMELGDHFPHITEEEIERVTNQRKGRPQPKNP